MEETILLEGAISVKAALEGKRRTVYRLLTDGRRPDRDRAYVLALAEKENVPVEVCTPEQIGDLAQGRSHGGLLAEAGARRYESPQTLFAAQDPLIALLDGIEDPFHFGDALRSLCAAGFTGVLVSPRDWHNAGGRIVKASAGASEKLDVACVSDWDGVLREAKEAGFRLLCADRKDAVSLYEADLSGKLILAVGGALRGINGAISEHADQRIFLPYAGNFRNSLSAGAAVAAIAFEVMRRRRYS